MFLRAHSPLKQQKHGSYKLRGLSIKYESPGAHSLFEVRYKLVDQEESEKCCSLHEILHADGQYCSSVASFLMIWCVWCVSFNIFQTFTIKRVYIATSSALLCAASEVMTAGLPARSACRQQVHLPLRWAPGWKEGSMRSLQMLAFLIADSHWFNSFTFCSDVKKNHQLPHAVTKKVIRPNHGYFLMPDVKVPFQPHVSVK